jgi:hypothetical protein
LPAHSNVQERFMSESEEEARDSEVRDGRAASSKAIRAAPAGPRIRSPARVLKSLQEQMEAAEEGNFPRLREMVKPAGNGENGEKWMKMVGNGRTALRVNTARRRVASPTSRGSGWLQ